MTNKYSFLMGLEKTLLRTFIIAGPMLFMILPDTWMNVTLGGALTFLINLAKNYDLNEENES